MYRPPYHKIWGGVPKKFSKILELFLLRIVLVRGNPKSFQSLLFVKTQHLILEKFPSETKLNSDEPEYIKLS